MRPLAVLAACALTLSAPARAETAAGHYVLEGVMETGSELLLRPDGKFQYYLVYGALDMLAEGDWREDKGHVRLLTRKAQTNAPDGEPRPFEKLDMIVTRTTEGKAALETNLWDREVVYVRHDAADTGD